MVVDIEDLDTDEDMVVYQGLPFNGTMQASYPGGARWREFPYLDGFEHGLCREWYSSGQLKREWHAVWGVAQGKVCEWHKNGQIKSVAIYLKGAELEYDEWSDAGLLVTHRELDQQSELWKYANGSNP